MDSKKPEIDWQEFNYPPLIRLFHFRVSQLPQEHRTVVMFLFLSHLLILLASILDLVSNIIQAAMNLQKIRVLYSFLFLFTFNPLQTFIFYRGYIGICKQYSKLKMYKIFQPIAIILWIVFSIVAFLGFNGFTRVAYLFQKGAAAPAVFALFQDIVLLVVAGLSSFCLFKAFKYQPTDQIEKLKQKLDFSTTGVITKLF